MNPWRMHFSVVLFSSETNEWKFCCFNCNTFTLYNSTQFYCYCDVLEFYIYKCASDKLLLKRGSNNLEITCLIGNYSLVTFSCSFKRRMNHWYEGRSREACHLLAAGCCHAVRSVTSHCVASDSALRLWVVRKKTVMWADCQLEMESSASESPCAGTGKELHPLLWRPSVGIMT